MTSDGPPSAIQVDGRRARADRTRESIADALLALGAATARRTVARMLAAQHDDQTV